MRNVNSDRAYNHIRKKILNGEYPPGSALMTEELSADIGVSRTPVRDALRQLESDGLVSIRPRLGASVKKMDLTELREMCELRLALEGHAACLAALNRNEAELAEIRVALDSMRRLVDLIAATKKEDVLVAELMREDVRFHIAVMAAAKNDLMRREILRLHLINRVVAGTGKGEAELTTKPERDARRHKVLQSHTEIYDAIARRDGAAAKAAMEEHIQELIEHSLRQFAQNESARPTRGLTADEMLYTA